MIERLRGGTTYGYLAYVGDRVAGWVNASLRAEYGLFRKVDVDGPTPSSVIGVSCFVIAPPFRRHGVAAALLDRVVADAATRGADRGLSAQRTEGERRRALPRTALDVRGARLCARRGAEDIHRDAASGALDGHDSTARPPLDSRVGFDQMIRVGIDVGGTNTD